MQYYKLTGILVVSLLILVVILQNTESVETYILFFSFEMPRALLLFLTALLGFAGGVFTSLYLGGKEKTSSSEE